MAIKERYCNYHLSIRTIGKRVDEFRQICYTSSMTTDTIGAALRRLELSLPEQTIYLSLLQQGQSTARLLAERTGLTRPSVYDQLKTLIGLDLVVELSIEGKAQFAAAPLKHLEALLTDRIDRLEQSLVQLSASVPTLEAGLTTVIPKIRFFEGTDGVKQILKDIMWHDHTTLQMIWATEKITAVYDDAFLRWFDERRLVRQLAIEILTAQPLKKSTGGLLTSGLKDVQRCLPKGVSIPLSTIIYDSKVAFISSQAEAFGFIVESREFASVERIKFAALWGV